MKNIISVLFLLVTLNAFSQAEIGPLVDQTRFKEKTTAERDALRNQNGRVGLHFNAEVGYFQYWWNGTWYNLTDTNDYVQGLSISNGILELDIPNRTNPTLVINSINLSEFNNDSGFLNQAALLTLYPGLDLDSSDDFNYVAVQNININGFTIENLSGLSISGALDTGEVNTDVLNVNALSNFTGAASFNSVFNLPLFPEPPTIDIRQGSMYIDSDDGLLYIFDGISTWISSGSGSGDFFADGSNPMTGNLDLNSLNILNGGTGDFALINSTAITLGNGASNPTINVNGTSGNFPFIFTPTEITYGGVPVLNPTAGRINTSSLTAVNYTPTTATVLTGHLSGIDTKLGELENDPITQATFAGDIQLTHENAWNVGNYNKLKSNSNTNVRLLPPTDGIVGDSWEIKQIGTGQIEIPFPDVDLSVLAGQDVFVRTNGPGALIRIDQTPSGYDVEGDKEVFNPVANLYTQATAANPINEINSAVGIPPQTGIDIRSVESTPTAQNGTYSLVFERTAATGTTIRPIIPLGDLGDGSSFIVSVYVQEVQGTDFQIQLSTSHGWVNSEAIATTSGGWTLYTFASNTVDSNDPRIRINFLNTTVAGDILAIDHITVTAN